MADRPIEQLEQTTQDEFDAALLPIAKVISGQSRAAKTSTGKLVEWLASLLVIQYSATVDGPWSTTLAADGSDRWARIGFGTAGPWILIPINRGGGEDTDTHYAFSEISSVASIPASPGRGDVLRFLASISDNIPDSLKERDGTTTVSSIAVGDEFRYDDGGSKWLKIGDGGGNNGASFDIDALTESAIIDEGDYLPFRDTGNSDQKKITVENFKNDIVTGSGRVLLGTAPSVAGTGSDQEWHWTLDANAPDWIQVLHAQDTLFVGDKPPLNLVGIAFEVRKDDNDSIGVNRTLPVSGEGNITTTAVFSDGGTDRSMAFAETTAGGGDPDPQYNIYWNSGGATGYTCTAYGILAAGPKGDPMSISDLDEDSAVRGDYIAFEDADDGNLKKETIADLLALMVRGDLPKLIEGLTAIVAARDDKLLVGDTSDSDSDRQITIADLLGLLETGDLPAEALNEQTADYTTVAADRGKIVRVSGTAAVTITLHNAAAGFALVILNSSTAGVSVACTGADTIDGAATITIQPGDAVRVVSTSDSAWEILARSAEGEFVIDDLTAESTVSDADAFAFHDQSANAERKISVADLKDELFQANEVLLATATPPSTNGDNGDGWDFTLDANAPAWAELTDGDVNLAEKPPLNFVGFAVKVRKDSDDSVGGQRTIAINHGGDVVFAFLDGATERDVGIRTAAAIPHNDDEPYLRVWWNANAATGFTCEVYAILAAGPPGEDGTPHYTGSQFVADAENDTLFTFDEDQSNPDVDAGGQQVAVVDSDEETMLTAAKQGDLFKAIGSVSSSWQLSAAAALGATTISVDSGSGDPRVGDWFTVSNSDPADTRYRVTAYAGNSITFTPGLALAAADNDTLKFLDRWQLVSRAEQDAAQQQKQSLYYMKNQVSKFEPLHRIGDTKTVSHYLQFGTAGREEAAGGVSGLSFLTSGSIPDSISVPEHTDAVDNAVFQFGEGEYEFDFEGRVHIQSTSPDAIADTNFRPDLFLAARRDERDFLVEATVPNQDDVCYLQHLDLLLVLDHNNKRIRAFNGSTGAREFSADYYLPAAKTWRWITSGDDTTALNTIGIWNDTDNRIDYFHLALSHGKYSWTHGSGGTSFTPDGVINGIGFIIGGFSDGAAHDYLLFLDGNHIKSHSINVIGNINLGSGVWQGIISSQNLLNNAAQQTFYCVDDDASNPALRAVTIDIHGNLTRNSSGDISYSDTYRGSGGAIKESSDGTIERIWMTDSAADELVVFNGDGTRDSDKDVDISAAVEVVAIDVNSDGIYVLDKDNDKLVHFTLLGARDRDNDIALLGGGDYVDFVMSGSIAYVLDNANNNWEAYHLNTLARSMSHERDLPDWEYTCGMYTTNALWAVGKDTNDANKWKGRRRSTQNLTSNVTFTISEHSDSNITDAIFNSHAGNTAWFIDKGRQYAHRYGTRNDIDFLESRSLLGQPNQNANVTCGVARVDTSGVYMIDQLFSRMLIYDAQQTQPVLDREFAGITQGSLRQRSLTTQQQRIYDWVDAAIHDSKIYLLDKANQAVAVYSQTGEHLGGDELLGHVLCDQEWVDVNFHVPTFEVASGETKQFYLVLANTYSLQVRPGTHVSDFAIFSVGGYLAVREN